MDGQRDIHAASKLSVFFDKTPARHSLSLNQPADRLYRRAERVVAAIFLATNHIPASESLRKEARETSLLLLRESLALRDELRASQSRHVSAFRASVRFLTSLLRMLTVGGFISLQNAAVLIEALDELGAFLQTAQASSLSDTVSFSREDLIDVQSPVKDKVNVKDKTSIKDRDNVSDRGTQGALSVRKENVLDVLKGGGSLGIADVSAHLPEYSTKMIQRDLLELVAAGRVKKSGNKRWSKYSIA